MRNKINQNAFLRRNRLFFLGIGIGLLLPLSPFQRPSFQTVHLEENSWKQPTCLDTFPFPTTTPIIQRKGYTVAYDGKNRTAHWVYRRLTKEQGEKRASRERVGFREDPILPAQIRATLRDYEGSGFDRGHLSPAYDNAFSKTELQESFYLSNIVPQLPEFNRGCWKRLENYVRSLVKDCVAVHIFVGPLYSAHKGKNGKNYVKYQVIGKNQVGVPTHFFALIFLEKEPFQLLIQGYILPNQAISSLIPLQEFQASLEEIERASGVIFSKVIEKPSSFWASREEKNGYEQGLDDAWAYDEGCYDGMNNKRPRYFHDPFYMDGFRNGKKDK